MRGRKGFTLTELLVCVAIVAVLLALFLPLVSAVRGVAMNTVCTSRLRDLLVACNAYRLDHEEYPKLGPGRDTSPGVLASLLHVPQPQELDAPFVNGLGKYLNVPNVGDQVDASELPPLFQCPMVEDAEPALRDALLPASLSVPSFYTGYVYVGRVDEQPPALPMGLRVELLRPDRPATRRNASAVLWADDVHWSLGGGGGSAWTYGHRKPAKGVRAGPLALSLDSPAALGGQHRAFTDGHVEWVDCDRIAINLLDPILGGGGGVKSGERPRDRGAALRIEPIYYLWF